ncbi:MAG TPA: methylated-DNA--[protein]-cysteine S-methyltransferase [Ignavibacteriales bacterium]|nr:methylated-DNA--[protein]-cysteine S-methyltransferase [Ignavibacteriales bacterium]
MKRILVFNEQKIAIEIVYDNVILKNINFVSYDNHHFDYDALNDFEKKVYDELFEYLEGQRKNFTIPIEIKGTNFQKKVYNELLKIPYGEVVSYQDIAIKLGDKKYSRAVGNALNKNKLPIIIPCHRVINKNRNLGGYAGGIELKKYLLTIEKVRRNV